MKIKLNIYNKRWLIILPPLVGLIIVALFYNQPAYEGGDNALASVLHGIVITTGLWIGCMNIVTFLWHKYPWEHTPLKHLIYEIILITAYTFAFSSGVYFVEVKLGIFEPADEIYLYAVITLLITYLITSIHEAAEFYKQWKLNFSKSAKLEKDNIEAKYETLKQQINPHFLFNSLNSLTTLVEDNEKAVDYIQNLSEFLRYVLKSRDRELVLVRNEVDILKKYLDIQKSRFNNNLQVELSIDEKYFHYSLPPLVLQMLTENCIKHNIISKENPLCIFVKAENNRISISNNLQKKLSKESTGNGLKNISERFSFFTNEDVKIQETNTTFKVSVPLLTVEL